VTLLKFAEARITCDLLLEQGHFERALWVLGLALPNVRTEGELQQMLALVERVPESERISSVEAAVVYIRILKKNHRLQSVLDWGARVSARYGFAQAALLQFECAGALLELQRHAEARQVLEGSMPHLQGEALGMAFSRLGLALFHLGEAWQESFKHARPLLTGDSLARVLTDHGYCLSESGQGAEARNVWREALPLCGHDPKMLAWVRYNLGISALLDLDWEAERHFLEADRLTHKPQAAALRAATLNGLGGARRMLGEWERALYAYHAGLEVAHDAHDHRESHFGLTRTLRLAGRHEEALEAIEFAFKVLVDHNPLRVTQAMVFLQLEQLERAKSALEDVGLLVSEYDRWLERIARSELARQEGQFDLAVQLLEGLPVNSLHAREEAGAFPLLFQLLEGAGKPVPVPLEYVKGTLVQVRALGVLHVSVNSRSVAITPTSRIGELLVYLLEQRGAASLESIGDALYAEANGSLDPKRVRQSVWKLVNGLREALGWQDSVLALRGAYQLDPNASWTYDVREARDRGQPEGEFLKGVYSDWALEVGRQLEMLHSEQPHHHELN
jgi:tetratricopeptide (TPR) repeat protein